MKLLTALIASASVSGIALFPSIASAGQFMSDREVAIATFCSYPTLVIKNGGSALEDCVQIAMEANARGYDGIALKRITDRFTARTIGTSEMVVSSWTANKLQDFAEDVRAGRITLR